MFELSGHEHANGSQVDHLRLGEVGGPYHVDVAVHDACGDEQGFILVLLLGVEVKYFLDSVGAVIWGYHLVGTETLLEANSFDYSLANRELFLFGGQILEVVGHEECLLKGSES